MGWPPSKTSKTSMYFMEHARKLSSHIHMGVQVNRFEGCFRPGIMQQQITINWPYSDAQPHRGDVLVVGKWNTLCSGPAKRAVLEV